MNNLIVTDPGHGGKDPGAVGNKMNEKDVTLSIGKFCNEYLLQRGAKVLSTRENDIYIGVNERAAFANKHKATLFVSIHTNAGGGDGVEVIYSQVGGISKVLAQNMVDSINKVTGQNKRAREIYTKVGSDGGDYFGVIRQTNMPAIIVECAFIDSKDAEIIDSTSERKLMGEAIAKGILKTLGIEDNHEEVEGTPIIGPATANVEQCKTWAKSKQAKQIFIDNADIYFEICKQVGINPVMAYAQYALESGYGHHKGTVPESYCNPCGLKIDKGGSDTDKNAHKQFVSWEEGISAHVDHIALYAGMSGYPISNSLDPRHFSYLLGKYKTVEEIGRGWCPSNPNYGNTLIKFMKEISNTKVEDRDEFIEAVYILVEHKIIGSPDYWIKITDKNTKALIIKMAKYILINK